MEQPFDYFEIYKLRSVASECHRLVSESRKGEIGVRGVPAIGCDIYIFIFQAFHHLADHLVT